MAWARYDDELPMNKKVAWLRSQGLEGLAALGLHLLCNTWSRHQGTAGSIPGYVPVQLWPKGDKLAGLLEQAGMFDAADDGWMIHDFTTYSDPKDDGRPAAEKKKEISAVRAVVGSKGGKASAKAKQAATKTSGLLEQTSSPVPDPVNPLYQEHDDLQLPGRPPSSSFKFEEVVAHQLARLTLQRNDIQVGNPDAWITKVRRTILEERVDDIRQWMDMGLDATQIAIRCAGPAPGTKTADVGHPSDCVCDGTGWVQVDPDDESRASYASPCTASHPSGRVLEMRRAQ